MIAPNTIGLASPLMKSFGLNLKTKPDCASVFSTPCRYASASAED